MTDLPADLVTIEVSDLLEMGDQELVRFAEDELNFYLSTNATKEANIGRLLSHGLVQR